METVWLVRLVYCLLCYMCIECLHLDIIILFCMRREKNAYKNCIVSSLSLHYVITLFHVYRLGKNTSDKYERTSLKNLLFITLLSSNTTIYCIYNTHALQTVWNKYVPKMKTSFIRPKERVFCSYTFWYTSYRTIWIIAILRNMERHG